MKEQEQEYSVLSFYKDNKEHNQDTYVDKLLVNKDMQHILPVDNDIKGTWLTLKEYIEHIKTNKKNTIKWRISHENQMRIYEYGEELINNKNYSHDVQH